MNKELEGLAKYMQQIQKSKQAFYLYLMDESIKNPHHIDPSYHPSVVAFNICREIQKIPFSYPEYVRPYHTPKELDAKKLREISLGIKAYRQADENEREIFKKEVQNPKKESKILAFFRKIRQNTKH
jgi:hypothetical protein